jgi:glycosyltransferase involved in cell wall biosynthesis
MANHPLVPLATKTQRAAKPLHLLLATVEDPHDPASWSGTPFHMLHALQAQFGRVSVLSSPRPERSAGNAALRLLLGANRYPLWMTRHALRHYAKGLEQAIAESQPDAVLCISSQHLAYGAGIDSGGGGGWGVPVFMVSDAPWMAYRQTYQEYDAQPLLAQHYGALEARSAQRVTGVVYPTPWACAEASKRFGLGADRVDCIPFGANRYCAESDAVVAQRVRNKAAQPVEFLFVGKDWERKGGPMALEVLRHVIRLGCPARLTIAGCAPRIDADLQASVQVLGFLSPTVASDQAHLQAAFEQAHFFLLPSRAECFGLVFAEAQSYGLPCIALANQGIPGVVDDGSTGLLFAPDTDALAIAQRVLALANNRATWQAMADAARKKFSDTLNWSAFGARMHQRIALACEEATVVEQR